MNTLASMYGVISTIILEWVDIDLIERINNYNRCHLHNYLGMSEVDLIDCKLLT